MTCERGVPGASTSRFFLLGCCVALYAAQPGTEAANRHSPIAAQTAFAM